MLNIQEYVNIKDYCTLKVGGQFRYFTKLENIDDFPSLYTLVQADEKYKDIKLFILGGGSNIVFSDGILNLLAIKMDIKGFEIISQTENYTDIKVGAGENWDNFVRKTVDMDLSGIEALSAIPGTVGAGPVQNIGAYGSEVKDTILEVEVYDIENKKIKKISNADCKFGYRDSIFKNEAKGKYVIVSVIYRLSKIMQHSKTLSYPGVLKYFEERGIKEPNLKEIRQAIIEIRKSKLPNPNETPNVGSFFKNPIVLNEIANKIKNNFPDVKFFPVGQDYTKIPAGWLIENVGLKGKTFGKVSIFDKNALVLVNSNNANFEDVISTKNEIIKTVKDKFGIILEQEPEIITN